MCSHSVRIPFFPLTNNVQRAVFMWPCLIYFNSNGQDSGETDSQMSASTQIGNAKHKKLHKHRDLKQIYTCKKYNH